MDIKIKNLDKFKNKDLLKNKLKITEKYDGTKLILLRNNKEYSENFEDNWYIIYKNQILYYNEFKNISSTNVYISNDIAQYKLIFNHLKKIHKNLKYIKKNTEFFIEFIQNKLTLTRDYNIKYKLYLLAYAEDVKYKIYGDMIKFEEENITYINCDYYAKKLNIERPRILFEGYFNDLNHIMLGIKDKNIYKIYSSIKDFYSDFYFNFKRLFLEFESELGGIPEGAVIEDLDNKKLYKIVQQDQYNKELRLNKKLKYVKDLNIFFKDVYKALDELLIYVELEKDFKYKMETFVNILYKEDILKYFNKDNLKNKVGLKQYCRDMIHNVARKVLSEGNDNKNGLILGKFRVFTKAHFDIIGTMLKECTNIVICIVRPKKFDGFRLELEDQIKIIKEKFKKDLNRIEIITHSTGNLNSILLKCPMNIHYIYCGTDRVQGYKEQIGERYWLKIREIKRNNNISATEVIEHKKYEFIDEKVYEKLKLEMI